MKNKILRIVIMLLVVTMVWSAFAPIASYATSKAMSKETQSKTTTTKKNDSTISKEISKDTSANLVGSKTTTSIVDRIKEYKSTNTETTDDRTKTLTKIYESIQSELSKEVKEIAKPVETPVENLDGVTAKLETVIYKGFSRIENIEAGSSIVYTIYLKNDADVSKSIKIASNDFLKNTSVVASICNIDYNVGDSEADKILIEERNAIYKGSLDIVLGAKEEKAIRMEQNYNAYNAGTINNSFIVSCGNSSTELSYTNKVLTPAKISADIALYVNNKEVATGTTIELKKSDVVKYIINLKNSGETVEKINISDTLPRELQITKIEYLDSNNRVIFTEESDNNNMGLAGIEISANEHVRIELTVEPRINGEILVENFATVDGDYITKLNTNVLTHKLIVADVENEININETFEKEEPQRSQTDDILNYFGDVSFLGYGLNNIGSKITVPFKGTFRKTKNMFCVNEGKDYYQELKIQNFFVNYNGKNYKYDKSTKTLKEYNGSIDIGNDTNFINSHYNELAYLLSEVNNYNSKEFYQSLGIDFSFNGDRPDHRLSPVQLAIWRLQGVTNSKMITKMNNVLKNDYNVSSSVKRNTIINNILSYTTRLYANAKAYNKYVEAGYIGTKPNITFNATQTIQVNGKTLVGPFKITYPIEKFTAKYTTTSGEEKSKTGKYGNIYTVKLENNGVEYSKVYNSAGEEITISSVYSDSLDCYFDITGKNFDLYKDSKITVKMNNQYRRAYFYTIASQASGYQNVIAGNGKYSYKSYYETFKLEQEIEKINLSGKVWLDKQQGTKTGIMPPNGIIDDNEEGIPNVKVYLLDNDQNKVVSVDRTNENGVYYFSQKPKANYTIIIEYDGINYIVSEAAQGETNSSKNKFKEDIIVNGRKIRSEFNDRFMKIVKDKEISEEYTISNNGQISEISTTGYKMEYDLKQGTQGNYVSKLITTENNEVIAVYKMYAQSEGTYNASQYNINMGLKARKGDLNLNTYIDKVELANEQNETITYAVDLNNQQDLLSIIDEFVYYYNTNLQLVDAEARFTRNGQNYIEGNIQTVNENTISINGKTYNKMTIKLPMLTFMLEGGRTTVYLKFKIREGTDLSGDFKAYGEIKSYSISGGIVDRDSAPDNGIKQDGTILQEDDFGEVRYSTIRSYILQSTLKGLLQKY